MLEMAHVDAFYGNSRALQEINLSVGRGEFLSVLGRNGVGKTTLMKTILGLMDRITGKISLDGVELSSLASGGGWGLPIATTDKEISRKGIDFVAASLRVAPS